MSDPSARLNVPMLRMKALQYACNHLPEDTSIGDLMQMTERVTTYLRFSDFDAPRAALSPEDATKMVWSMENPAMFVGRALPLRRGERAFIELLKPTSRPHILYNDEERTFDLVCAWVLWSSTTRAQGRTALIAPDEQTLALIFERLVLVLDRLPPWLRISSEHQGYGRLGIYFENSAAIIGFTAPSPPRGMGLVNAIFFDGEGSDPEGLGWFWADHLSFVKTMVLSAVGKPQPLTKHVETAGTPYTRHVLEG